MNDSLDELREQNLRDPRMHAHALFTIERSNSEIAGESTRIREAAEEQLEVIKERYADLSSFLLNSSNLKYIPRIESQLRQIKFVVVLVAVIMVLLLLK